jgi:hypothetical protein
LTVPLGFLAVPATEKVFSIVIKLPFKVAYQFTKLCCCFVTACLYYSKRVFIGQPLLLQLGLSLTNFDTVELGLAIVEPFDRTSDLVSGFWCQ